MAPDTPSKRPHVETGLIAARNQTRVLNAVADSLLRQTVHPVAYDLPSAPEISFQNRLDTKRFYIVGDAAKMLYAEKYDHTESLAKHLKA